MLRLRLRLRLGCRLGLRLRLGLGLRLGLQFRCIVVEGKLTSKELSRVGGWLEQLGIRLSQHPTKLKLKLKLSLAIVSNK